jgi:predicted dehydrogenase
MINVGVIGLGYWGPNLVRNFYTNINSSVNYCCDLLDENIEKTKEKFPTASFTKDHFDILGDNEIDLICIATPPETHFRLARDALEHGKHVLVEKPMTTTVKEGKKLIEIANKAEKLLMVDHTFVFSPPVIKIKGLIGNIGDPLYFDSERVNLGLLQKDVNVIWDLAPHDFSILTYLFPGLVPKSLQVTASRQVHPKYEDIAHILIEYENGFSAHIHVSWLSPVKIRKTIIGGNKKMIWYDDVDPFEKVKLYDSGIDMEVLDESPFFPSYRKGDILIPKLENKEPLSNEVENVVGSILGKVKPIVDGNEGLKVVKLLEACDRSLKNKKRIKID